MYLELISNNIVEQKVELLEQQSSLTKLNEAKINVVYQDTNYRLFLGDISENENVSIIGVLINNQEVDFNFGGNGRDIIYSAEKSGYFIEFYSPLFNMIYGITDIVIIFQINEVEVIYYTPFFAVAIKQDFKDTMNSIYAMLDDIYLKDHCLLQSEKYQNNLDKYLKNKEQNKLEYEISLLQEIIILFKQNTVNFINNPKTIPTNVDDIDSFEKLRIIGSKNVQHIICHPNELHKLNTPTGININNNYYIPRKTLISTIQASKDTIENHAIISFLNTLLDFVNKQINELKNQISLDGGKLFVNEGVRSGYIVSFVVIEQYLKISFKDYLDKLQQVFSALKEIEIKYKKELIDTKERMYMVPPPTATFLEVYHYRKIYECIVTWFSFGKSDIPKQNTVMHFYTGDKIYEYYCLLNLIDILNSLGFKEDVTKRLLYLYDIKDYNRYLSVYNYNTFYFTKDQKMEVTLYYQPVIYSNNSSKRNDISLFRTDKSKFPFFTPDFIIKVSCNNQIRYGILDAKWKNRKSINKNGGGFQDCLCKYYASVCDEKTLIPVSFMWVMQGKDDTQKTYYHQNSTISNLKGEDFSNSIGIVRFTPRSGLSEMIKILNQFLS